MMGAAGPRGLGNVWRDSLGVGGSRHFLCAAPRV